MMEKMETRTSPLRLRRFTSLVRPGWSRLVATLGIIVLLVGLDVPFAGREYILYGYPPQHVSTTWTIGSAALASVGFLWPVRLLSLPLKLGLVAIFSALTLGGLALIPVLWQPLSTKGAVRLRWTYAAWLVTLAVLIPLGVYVWWRAMTLPIRPSVAYVMPVPDAEVAPHLLPGVAVFPLGALICFGALSLMFSQPMPESPTVIAPRTGLQWASSLAISLGALIWVVGFYLMPEAVTAACPPITFSVTQFAHGACGGLDSDQVLAHAYQAGLNPLTRALYHLGGHFELLVAVACITSFGAWTRYLAVSSLAWLAIWPTLALGVALVALQGVGVVAQHGFALTSATSDNWHMASGMIVTFAGIGMVAFGELGLWCEWARRRALAKS